MTALQVQLLFSSCPVPRARLFRCLYTVAKGYLEGVFGESQDPRSTVSYSYEEVPLQLQP